MEDKMAMDAKKIAAELLAERKAREELERNNRELLTGLMKQQAQRDKGKREADLREKRMEAESKAARAEQARAELAERERLEQAKREKELKKEPVHDATEDQAGWCVIG